MTTYPGAELLVDAAWLDVHRDDPNLVVVDCALAEDTYRRAHVPGARCLPRHPYLKADGEDGNPGRLVLDAGAFSSLAATLGIGPDTTVVAYDDKGSLFAARLWWVMRYYGHDCVKVLDGGWQGWIAHGGAVSHAAPPPVAQVPPIEARPAPQYLATVDQLRAGDPGWQVVDVRSDGEWEGTASRGNARVGHVPGAVHLEWHRVLHNSADAQRVRNFRSAAEIEKLFAEAGLRKDATPVTYCQAGIRASLAAFTFELMGYPAARVYDGSMGEWANLDDTPLE